MGLLGKVYFAETVEELLVSCIGETAVKNYACRLTAGRIYDLLVEIRWRMKIDLLT
jgi:hypothetical protein